MDDRVVEAVIAAVGTIGSGVFAQISVWRHQRQQVAAQRARDASGLAVRRLELGDDANERLFENFALELKECRRDQREMRIRLDDAERQVAELRGDVIRFSVRDEAMQKTILAAGLALPAMPIFKSELPAADG